MAESFSVKAILSAKDSGFSSTLKSSLGTLDKFDKKISGFSFGLLTGAGQAAFQMITNGARDMVSEINDSSKAWQTFEGNMKNFGKTDKEIAKVKNELQSFAETTVYSSSDMASTFAQLEAVGVGGMKKLANGTTGLVKGFGGLAAAAENPQQAMKSLSQQATQMAAKPKVAWEDFKIMLEQSPAGMAAVAKEMGISTEKLITKIQKGEVKTQDFFAAVEAAGNSDGFQEQATKAKTVDQAMDGLKETIGNKLLPTFNNLSQIGIKAINGIADKIGKIDADAIATKVSGWVEDAQPYWQSFKETAAEVGGVIKQIGGFLAEHKDTISKAVPWLIKGAIAYKGFKVVSTVVAPVASFTKNIAALAGKGIGGIASKLFGISKSQQAVGTASVQSGASMLTAAKSYALMGVAVLAIAAGFALLAFSAVSLANAGGLAIGVMAGLVVGVAAMGVGMAALLKTLAPMGAQMMPVATAFLAMGAAVLLVSAGFAVLALTSIQLANAGGAAIGVMVGMVTTIALLAVGAAALAPALTAGAVGLIAFGAAMVLVGTGALIASAALAVVSAVLPAIVTHGTAGAGAIAALGASMIVFAAGAVTAGAALVVLSAGMVVFGASVVVASAGMVIFAAGMVTGAAGTLVMAAALKAVSSQMKTISKSAKTAEKSLKTMRSSVKAVESGLSALGSKAKSALNSLKNAFDDTASSAQSAGTKAGNGFADGMRPGLLRAVSNTQAIENQLTVIFNAAAVMAISSGMKTGTGYAKGMKSGLTAAPKMANTSVKAVNSALRSGYSGAYSAGAYVSKGFAVGMRSQLGAIKSAAAQMAAAAQKAIEAKARIASPSKETTKDGAFFGEGWVNGILSKVREAGKAAKELVTFPKVATPAFAGGYGYELSGDYEYHRDMQAVIEVPVVVDGREVARATATYTQDELNKQQTRDSRKQGRK